MQETSATSGNIHWTQALLALAVKSTKHGGECAGFGGKKLLENRKGLD
jgi:hypothetical protein